MRGLKALFGALLIGVYLIYALNAIGITFVTPKSAGKAKIMTITSRKRLPISRSNLDNCEFGGSNIEGINISGQTGKGLL